MERSTAPGWKSSFLVGTPDPNSAVCTPLAIRVWNFNLWPMMSRFFASCRREVARRHTLRALPLKVPPRPPGPRPPLGGQKPHSSSAACDGAMRRRSRPASRAATVPALGARLLEQRVVQALDQVRVVDVPSQVLALVNLTLPHVLHRAVALVVAPEKCGPVPALGWALNHRRHRGARPHSAAAAAL